MSELFKTIESTVRGQRNRYYGKYRAIVTDVDDPKAMGRVKLSIPSVLGTAESDWALPVVPYGGGEHYGFLAIPPVDSAVVAEFLEGDPSQPMWTGAFWRQSGQAPQDYADKGQATKVLMTESGHKLVLDDTSGEEQVTLVSSAGAELVMDANGSLVLTDSAGSTVTLDAEAGELTVADGNGNSLVMSPSGIICTDANGNEIKASGSGVEIKASATVNIEGSMVTVAGSGGEPLVKGTTFLSLFNSHTHPTAAPGAPTLPPMVPLTPTVLTTKSTAS
ncbi:phage baseplate assembly protein V [Mesobacterium pallidum]|uniref:phage baseplate assembly protein V n=1 Tax=Mesobacterium pallidum TaxID=2872037 RepID=UPI001EE2E101|nr:phage baseplate assembly protein V [Mesobacterium pallidum]